MPRTQPVLVDENGEIMYPNDETGVIKVKPGTRVTFLCTGEGNHFINKEFSDDQYKTLEADGSGNFKTLDGQIVDVSSLECDKVPEPSIEIASEKLKNSKLQLCSVGFRLPNGNLAIAYQVMYDLANRNAHFASYVLRQHVRAGRTTSNRPQFRDLLPIFERTSIVSQLYKRQSQMQNLPHLRISDQGNMLQIGHLAPNAHFPTIPLQRATFDFLNSAPQFGLFNMNNWRQLEAYLAEFASIHGDINIYVGTAVADPTRQQYMSPLTQQVRIPSFFWIIQVQGDRSVAFVGANSSPNEAQNSQSYQLIKDIPQLTNTGAWFGKSFRNDPQNGIIRCVTIDTLASIIGEENMPHGIPRTLLDTDIGQGRSTLFKIAVTIASLVVVYSVGRKVSECQHKVPENVPNRSRNTQRSIDSDKGSNQAQARQNSSSERVKRARTNKSSKNEAEERENENENIGQQLQNLMNDILNHRAEPCDLPIIEDIDLFTDVLEGSLPGNSNWDRIREEIRRTRSNDEAFRRFLELLRDRSHRNNSSKQTELRKFLEKWRKQKNIDLHYELDKSFRDKILDCRGNQTATYKVRIIARNSKYGIIMEEVEIVVTFQVIVIVC